MSPEVRAAVAELGLRLRELYGERLVRVVLFGSRARGDAEPDSDIDVLVVLRGDVDPYEEIERTGEDVARISLRNDVVLSRSFVSEASYGRGLSPFLLNVRKEGVAV